MSTKSQGIQPRSLTQEIKLNNKRDQRQIFSKYLSSIPTQAELNSKLDSNHSYSKRFKTLIIIYSTIISSFIFVAIAISIYLLIHVMETTIIGTTISNPLHTSYHVTLDSSDSLYISDSDNHRVQKYLKGASSETQIAGSTDQSKGKTVASVTGTSSNSANLLNTPFSVALDTQRNLYVADMANSRIQQFI
ncbi:unnamed protein product [Rotaria sp. Silwood2]|nr:unnamed protein product [Rotaria sp. Silwood2]CAF2969380.1 unnamed protein product [Rotaria sp. Silwood2]CAF3280205.1 unnamed protein product [Rotaria sp. Silwood2]CAF4491790.1 unnamed protein product [Rotaria sp. Silwood2]